MIDQLNIGLNCQWQRSCMTSQRAMTARFIMKG
jgi:hypothetical protein